MLLVWPQPTHPGRTLLCPLYGDVLAPRAMPGWHSSGLSMAMAYLELPQDGGDVGLIGQVGEDLQL